LSLRRSSAATSAGKVDLLGNVELRRDREGISIV
jgi:hypothetical protein